MLNRFINQTQQKQFGRYLLAALFIVSGLQTLTGGFLEFSNMIAQKGFPMPDYFAYLALGLKLSGGFGLLMGIQTELAVNALLLFMVAATGLYHNPIADPGQMTNFLKNLAVIGGLMLV